MRTRALGIVIAIAGLAGTLGVAVRTAAAQTAADLFDVNTLQELRLSINSRDMTQLRAHFNLNTKYPADLTWRNVKVRNVAVRSRGTGSRNPIKLGLQLEFDHYTKNQKFLGLSSLVLKNLYQDKSMIRERMSMAFFARMGLPASRESFCKLYINNEYQGVYGIVENIDTSYLTRTLGDNTGYLFEFHSVYNYYGTYLGDAFGAYKPFFEPRTRELEPEATLYGPLRDLFREVNGPDDAVWRERVEQYVNLSQIVTYVAIESYLSEWDGFAGNWGMNNFNFYRRAGSTLHQPLVWDRDNSMQYPDSSIFFHNDENELIRRALAFPDLRALYLDVLEQCAASATEDGWYEAEVAKTTAVIAGAAHDDPRKPYTNDEYDTESQFIKDWAALRPAIVLQQVKTARGGSE